MACKLADGKALCGGSCKTSVFSEKARRIAKGSSSRSNSSDRRDANEDAHSAQLENSTNRDGDRPERRPRIPRTEHWRKPLRSRTTRNVKRRYWCTRCWQGCRGCCAHTHIRRTGVRRQQFYGICLFARKAASSEIISPKAWWSGCWEDTE